MIQLISREEVFYRSSLVDHYISNSQKFWYKQFGAQVTDYFNEKTVLEEDPYDHLEPFHENKEVLDDFAVLGYPKNKMDYIKNRSIALIGFFEQMGISQLYLMDEMKFDWLQFPYRSREKSQAIRDIVNKPAYHEAFEMDTDDLVKMLPLFNYSGRHSVAIILLFSANTPVPLGMFLCDDGNFHTSFPARDREKLSAASSHAGLIMGGLEVCDM